MSESRLYAFKALKSWLNSTKYIDHILESVSGSVKDRDKRFLDNLVNGTVMMHRQLDHIGARFRNRHKALHENVKILAWMGSYEILHQGASRDYATVHATVRLAKKLTPQSSGFLNALLRKILLFRDSDEWKKFMLDRSIPAGIRYSFPDWLVLRWQQQFPESWEKLLATLNSDPLKMIFIYDTQQRERILDTLGQLDLNPVVNPYHPAFVHVRSLQPLLSHDLLQKGHISIQDVSTLFPVKLLTSQPPESVTDVCSAPGGKLGMIKTLLPGTIPVTACDVSSFRLEQVKKNMQRLRYDNIEYLEADASRNSFQKSSHFLVDAPCSGFGVIRKRSDLRWRRQPGDISDLSQLQQKILHNVQKSITHGGLLVYSTCTFDFEENMGVVTKFLEKHPNFSIVPAPAGFPPSLVTESGAIQTLPHLHEAEGSFAIALKKK